MTYSSMLIIAAAAVFGLLGFVHLYYTYTSDKFEPRDPALRAAMMADSPVISRRTTIWRATKGFNASHSLGVIFIALVYGYLAGWQAKFFAGSIFLQSIGMIFFVCYAWLARTYWFSIPLRGIALASVLFGAGLIGIWLPPLVY